jgi:hypothetical protein
VNFRVEVKFVAGSFALLMGLVVPVSAALVDTTSSTELAPDSATVASSSFFVEGAPQPLLLMALGALVVLVPVTRRVLRAGQPVDRA